MSVWIIFNSTMFYGKVEIEQPTQMPNDEHVFYQQPNINFIRCLFRIRTECEKYVRIFIHTVSRETKLYIATVPVKLLPTIKSLMQFLALNVHNFKSCCTVSWSTVFRNSRSVDLLVLKHSSVQLVERRPHRNRSVIHLKAEGEIRTEGTDEDRWKTEKGRKMIFQFLGEYIGENCPNFRYGETKNGTKVRSS